MAFSVSADPFPPDWDNGAGTAIHHNPAAWPSEPVDPADCGDNCGEWKPYTRFQNSVNDPRSQDDSNGGTAPQNYVNIASSCVDKSLPSIYYYLHQGATPDEDVIMFRWRVEQIANTYATGPNAGAYNSSNPWSSALWTVFFDIDGSGYRSLAAHLDGSSGGPSEAIDLLAGIWSQSPKQSIDYINDPSVNLVGHNPTAFIDQSSGKILNFQNSVTPVANWPNGSSETSWDYGTSRARLITTRSCNEYFIDYQMPVAMLDATGLGGPKITRSTPISMMFCTANSLNDPFQKDCAINKSWAAESNKPAPFGDYISFDTAEPYSQPIVADVEAVAPTSCGQDYKLNARVQDVLALQNGEVITSVKSLDFYYWYDANGSGDADESGGSWVHAASGIRVAGSLNTWTANWSAGNLPKGRYLIGVQAVDDNTLVDEDMIPSGVDNRTFSYVAGNAQSQVYIDGAWITGQQVLFPEHSPLQTPGASENWYGNPEVTGIQTALVGEAINTCGVAPTVAVSVDEAEVAPGATVAFTVTISNTGNSEAITVSNLGNLLPDGFSYQNNSTSGDFGSANPTISSQNLSWDLGTPVNVASNASASLVFSATASADAGNYHSTATAVTSFGDLGSIPVAVSVGSARLALSIAPGSYSSSPGGQVSYTLNYSNPSTVAVDGLSLASTSPTNTTFQSCSASCSNVGSSVTWTLATLAPGGSGSVTLVVDVDSGYATNSLVVSATLSGTDSASNIVSETAQSSIYVNVPASAIAAFTLDNTASVVQVAPGGNVTYTIGYENYGGAAASNTVITDTIPAGMSYVSSTNGGVETNGVVSWSLGTVAANATGSVSVTVTADNPFEAINPAWNAAQIDWDGGTPVNASVDVGVTGLSCSTYYFRDTTTNVGFDGTHRVATSLPVPLTGDTGSTVTVTAPVSGSPYLEAVRFYQDPATLVDTAFSGNIDTTLYIDRANGPGLDLLTTLYDYDSVSGTKTQLGQQLSQFGGNTKGLLTFSVPLSGTLQRDHRLLWTIEVRSQHGSQFYDVEIQYNGTVTNGISGGTTFADSGASFCVTPPANLSIDKSVDVATVPESTTSNIVYTIGYANLGASSATNTAILDTLPTGVSFTSATLNGSPITPAGTNPYTFTVGTVSAGAGGSVVINASVSNTATGTLTNSASISSDQTSAVTDTASTLVGTPGGGGPTAPELYISKTASSSLLSAGDGIIYSLTVVNTGTADAANVVVTDDFPNQSYFTYIGCNTAAGTCSESPSGTLSWPVGTLAEGGSATLTYQMQVANTGIPSGLNILSSIANVSDDDYCTGTPPASCSSENTEVSISGNAELALGLTADSAAVVPGDVIQYTIVATNDGSSTASEVSVRNPIPSNTSFVEIVSGTGSFDTVNNQLLFTASSLSAGASATYVFTVQVATPLVSGTTTITDTATVTAANATAANDTVNSTATAAPVIVLSMSGEGNVPLPATALTADASNSTTLTVVSASLLSPGNYLRINGTFVQITSISGNLVTVNTPVTATNGALVELAATYSVTYQNTGNAAATNVQVSEPLLAGWVFVNASPAATSAPAVGSNGSISWALGTVAAGDSGTLQFVALPTTSGSATHSATLTADGAISETSMVTTLIGGLTVFKTALSEIAQPGGSVTYNISVSNSLSVPVNGVVVKDVLSAGFTTNAASTTTPDSYENGDLSRPIWNINVPANGSVLIEFTADISADVGAASFQNEVHVVAPAGIGVAKFDALSTISEDVTVLVASGLISGDVYYGSSPLAGVWVNFYENNVLAYRVYTDNAGHYQRVLEAGTNWRVQISSDLENSALLSGLTLTTGTDPENFTISANESINRTFVYSLTAPTVNTTVTNDTTPTITGTYPSTAAGGVLTLLVNGITYNLGADLVATGDNWILTIPLVDQLADGTYDVTATITSGNNSSVDSTSNELVISRLDTDSDGVIDVLDADDDNDGIPDTLEGGGAIDSDADGIVDSLDLDSDNDGLFDLTESGAANVSSLDVDNDGEIDSSNSVGANGLADAVETTIDSSTVNYNGGAALDTDSDGVEDFRDLDSDNDGIPDVSEAGGNDPDGDGILGTGTPTVDSNGLATDAGLTPVDSDGDGIGDQLELDSDNDGINDIVEAGGTDIDNDGQVDGFTDLDGDGFDDSVASSPLPLPDTDGDNIPDYKDNDDADNDGVVDSLDEDDDNDGIPDALEGDGSVDTDGDGVADSLDLDSDNDGLFDLTESGAANISTLDANNDGQIDTAFSVGANGLADTIETTADSGSVIYNGGVALDTDGDGITDFRDLDSDNDGIAEVIEAGGNDPDGDGILGTGTPSVDTNGLAAGSGLSPIDTDGDNVNDQLDLDSDGDGLYDLIEAGGPDSDNDGRVDGFTDANTDGLDDTITGNPLTLPDTDTDGVADRLDLDSDNDGIADTIESGGLDPDADGRLGSSPQTVDGNGVYAGGALTPLDTDGDGVFNQHDLDSDNDGVPDVTEAAGSDPDGDGILGSGVPTVDARGIANNTLLNPVNTDDTGPLDPYDLDSDDDGIYNLIEAGGVDVNDDGMVDGFTDVDGDGFDDFITLTPLPLQDSDGDNIPDFQDIDDLDNDGVADSVDVDDDNDGIPDTMEGDGSVDTDGDGIADSLDLDSDNDGIYDVIESGISDPAALDTDNDGRIDNTNPVGNNGLADGVETSIDNGAINYNGGLVSDTDADGVADFRDLDSDNDRIPDVTEVGGSDPDGDGMIGIGVPGVNNNGIPIGGGLTPIDSDGDSIPDYLDNTNNNNVIRTGVDGIGAFGLWLLIFTTLVIAARKYRLQKNIFILNLMVLLMFVSSSSVASEQQSGESKPMSYFIGAGIGYSTMAPETHGTIYTIEDDNDFGYRLFFGIDVNKYFTAEVSLSDLGTTKLKPSGEIDYSIATINGLFYFYDQGKNDHKGWAAYIKGGLGSLRNKANVPYEKENLVQFSLGAGIEYALSNGIAARLDLESFDDDASLLTIGLLYRFGKTDKSKPATKPQPKPQSKSKDSDYDGVLDEDDHCAHTVRDKPVDSKGCEIKTDKDNDGVFDVDDECPKTPKNTQVNSKGCDDDVDKDGVKNPQDECPDTQKGTKVDATGCNNDSDEDGVINPLDQCPDTKKGLHVNAQGCGVFKTEFKGVNFKLASAELTQKSKAILDQAAKVLLEYTNIRIEIQAHTDSQGKKKDNQKLSNARAKSVADYLESKGVSPKRMQSIGYGEDKPLASNKTTEGRAQNRRVEFHQLGTHSNEK